MQTQFIDLSEDNPASSTCGTALQPTSRTHGICPNTLTLCVDDADFDVIQNAIAARQLDLSRVAAGMTPSYWLGSSKNGNLTGRYVAEICRHWLVLTQDVRDENGERRGGSV